MLNQDRNLGEKTALHAGIIRKKQTNKPNCSKNNLKVVNEIICYVFTCVREVVPQEIHSSITFPHDICSEGCVDIIILVVCLK